MTLAKRPSDELQSYAEVGLDEIDDSFTLPRVRVLGKKGLFLDPITEQEVPQLNTIIFGQIQQRIMWDEQIDEVKSGPMCKSTDNTIGWPNVNPVDPEYKRFPWDESPFDLATTPVDPENNLPYLECAKCPFAEWGKNAKTGKGVPPRCGEKHVYPLAIVDDEGDLNPAVLTVGGASMKNSKAYAGLAKQRKKAMFYNATVLTLDRRTRGDVDYSVVVFRKAGETDESWHRDIVDQYFSMRDYLKRKPRNYNDDAGMDGPEADNTNVAPAEAVVAQPRPAAVVVDQPPVREPEPAVPVSQPAAAAKALFKPKATPKPVEPEVVEAEIVPDEPAAKPADPNDLPF